MGAPLTPTHRSDRVICRHFAEPGNSGGAGAPDVDRPSKSNCQNIETGPVHKVQVKVVLQLGCIQHFVRHLGYLAGHFVRSRLVLVVVQAKQVVAKQGVVLVQQPLLFLGAGL